MRLVLGGPHVSTACTLHVCVHQHVDAEWKLNVSKYIEILSNGTKFYRMG